MTGKTGAGALARAMWRGLLLRCPVCAQGRMPRGGFGVGAHCPACGTRYELGPGDFSGAIMIAQMLMGLLAIPVWVALTLWTPLGFTGRVVATIAILFALLFAFYGNVKGLWYGFLVAADRDGRTTAGTPAASPPTSPPPKTRR